MNENSELVVALDNVRRADISRVGGKNASLGELMAALRPAGVNVPPGFAITAAAYRLFVAENRLQPVIAGTLAGWANSATTLGEAGRQIREAFMRATWPAAVAEAIRRAYRELSGRLGGSAANVAVRSSATAEDLPEASFAGQLETFLNVTGEDALLEACRHCFASLFTDRAISYRQMHGFDSVDVALSVGVQQMVRSDRAGSGVMFSIDTETGFDRVVLIDAAWGLGEPVVQGQVDPDEYTVFKPLLADRTVSPVIDRKLGAKAVKMLYAEGGKATQLTQTTADERGRYVLNEGEVLKLARWACAIEQHYGAPMDMEWAKDGDSGELYVVQARPETVQSRHRGAALRTYSVKPAGRKLLAGLAIGQGAVAGKVCIVRDASQVESFPAGAVLVAENTDPDWLPLMKKAAAIVTDHGGRTSHAAIVSRELGVPALIGTGLATRELRQDQAITVSCAEGEQGSVYDGLAEIRAKDVDLAQIPPTRTRVMLNLANPDSAFHWWRLPADGVGLARMEFLISDGIRVHPMALAHPEQVADPAARRAIDELTRGYADPAEFFVERLSGGLARLAALCHPKPVIVRMSDFKTNEYANLIGGAAFEPREENPMLGFRGASRYYSPRYRDGFALECRAIRRLREKLGLRNVIVMIPFCRTPEEADRVLQAMADNGLVRGRDGLKVYVMCEIPSNVIQAAEFARRFDGFSIGSNDLTQLTLGVDRDSAELAPLFSENNASVKWLIEQVIERAHRAGVGVSLCGEAPSSHPDFARFLVQAGIDSVSVNPASFVEVKNTVAAAERAARSEAAPA